MNYMMITALSGVFFTGSLLAEDRKYAMYQAMNTDGDEVVSSVEYLDSWDAYFRWMDQNDDSELEESEATARLMKLADVNQDSRLSQAEHRALRRRQFETLDQNGDQELSLQELLRTSTDTAPNLVGRLGLLPEYDLHRAKIEALESLTNAPKMHLAEGFDSTDTLAAIYYEGLDWKGQPTKVFAWLGMPENYDADVPAMVLVHGGGGTAFKEWVRQWTRRGYAAISIAVEGQTDRKGDSRWEHHAWAGPQRHGIYHDSTERLEDQWMYHAVADTILAHSLLRSLDGVDSARIGLMGISWGGVITSTVIGIDDRFAFAIPTYGCGSLATAENQYGKSLRENQIYQQVWDPMLRFNQAVLPTLWFSWPEDSHFPMDKHANSYGAVAGDHMVCLVPEMGHGHGPAWIRPESYAFADSIVSGAGPWCVLQEASLESNVCRARFKSQGVLEDAMLISTTDHGVSGDRTWVQTPAFISGKSGDYTVTAALPDGSTAWFINVRQDGLIASSDYQEVR